MSYSKANRAVPIFQDISTLCDNMLSAPYSVHRLHKCLPQNQSTPPKNLSEKYIGDDNFSIYATSILGEIMIFFSVIKSISLHTQIFSLWKREITDNGNESAISKSFARVGIRNSANHFLYSII